MMSASQPMARTGGLQYCTNKKIFQGRLSISPSRGAVQPWGDFQPRALLSSTRQPRVDSAMWAAAPHGPVWDSSCRRGPLRRLVTFRGSVGGRGIQEGSLMRWEGVSTRSRKSRKRGPLVRFPALLPWFSAIDKAIGHARNLAHELGCTRMQVV